MKLTDLHKALMRKYDMTAEDANYRIEEMRQEVYEDNRDPDEVLFDEGLEPDYVMDLLF